MNEVLRSNLNIYKDERLKTDISPVEALSNEWSNQMSASYLSPNDQIDDTTKSILTDSIKNLSKFTLKSKEVVDHSTNEEVLKIKRIFEATRRINRFKKPKCRHTGCFQINRTYLSGVR